MHTKKVKGGVTDFWECYLFNKGLKNHIISFCGKRINVLFVIGVAAYYHREHILEFLENDCIQTGKLLTAIKDIKEKIFSACFQALHMMGKLVTSPLMCPVEEPKVHIFALND